jgi:hypothetical protein
MLMTPSMWEHKMRTLVDDTKSINYIINDINTNRVDDQTKKNKLPKKTNKKQIYSHNFTTDDIDLNMEIEKSNLIKDDDQMSIE